jgi:hypothetical protein
VQFRIQPQRIPVQFRIQLSKSRDVPVRDTPVQTSAKEFPHPTRSHRAAADPFFYHISAEKSMKIFNNALTPLSGRGFGGFFLPPPSRRTAPARYRTASCEKHGFDRGQSVNRFRATRQDPSRMRPAAATY